MQNGIPVGLRSSPSFGLSRSGQLTAIIQSLFWDGSQGWWYDDNDTTTLFQDSAGTTPVTAVEQFVGLQLDKSKGLVLGPQLFTDFTTEGTWTDNGNGSWSITSAVGAQDLRVDYVGTTNKRYVITVTVSGHSGSQLTIYPLNTAPYTAGNGSFTTRENSNAGFFIIRASSGASATVSNISIRELPGNHRYAPASGNRPIWSKRVNLYVGTTALATQNVTTQATSYVLRFSGTGSITLSGTATGSFNAGVHTVTCTAGTLTSTVSGTVTDADLRPANQATGLLPLYQRVNTSSDYDTNGFPGYLKADGVDDFLQTNSIDFNTVTSDGQPRRNLLLNPTQFDTATWGNANVTVTANAAVAPDGTTTADLLFPATTGSFRDKTQQITAASATYVASCFLKASGFRWAYFRNFSATNFAAHFDLQNGVLGTVQAGFTATITNAGNGWYRCTLTSATPIANPWIAVGMSDADNSSTATASGSNGILAWGAQLEVGSTATAFQNIGTDKITLCAGVRKLSDAGSIIAEPGGGALNTFSVINGFGLYTFVSRGSSIQSVNSPSNYFSPITNVVTGIGAISTDTCLLRINGTQVASNTGDQGTGNFGNYPAYFFRRGGTTLPFTGYEYGNIAVGKLLTADQLTALETYMNGLTKAY